ncbi:hypothetical protein L596_028962 [Steinernema carpocapsae]|uniref:Uncharacterized protein n=1 Tax=Steinernema carpocapsae TaxID=34508 RepID=A0A4U5LT79_STECR|nr:hypothetical protein L596_028962 [Steinernema carpocapsae]
MLPNLVPTTHQERSISEPAIRTTRANCRQVAVIRSCVTSEELFINYNCKQTNPHKCTGQSRRKHCTQKHSRRISKTRVGGGDFLERWNWKNSKDLRSGSGGRIISSFESLSSKMDLKFVTFLALFVSASAQFFGPSSCVGFNCGPPPLGPCFGVACPPPSVFLPPPAPAPCLFGVIGVACAPSPPPSVFIQAPLLLPASESPVLLCLLSLASESPAPLLRRSSWLPHLLQPAFPASDLPCP